MEHCTRTAILSFSLSLLLIPLLAPKLRSQTASPSPDLPDAQRLDAFDKKEIQEILELKRRFGAEVWPGFDTADIPVVLYDPRYQFLIGVVDTPRGWDVVAGDDFDGKPYHRRIATDTKGFAVRIGDRWAGSLGTFEHMNRYSIEKMKEQMSPAMRDGISPDFRPVAEDLHAVALLHEMFHALQAIRSPLRFERANASYTAEKNYPFDDEAFRDAWNDESKRLTQALRASFTDIDEARKHCREFLAIRDERRKAAGLSEKTLEFEREVEWLEGLGKYVEIRFHELAASAGEGEREPRLAYRPGLAHWSMEFARLDGYLGVQKGDFRFYLSGMAMGRLLDRLDPEWKGKALVEGAYLDELLRAAARSRIDCQGKQ